ncbi:two-component regulator propeller domain-containing protein [Candidatus Venteria ishoeyi]|uniref:Two component regulator propeller n=1 Tax=Candidatus Venteria ishoeyi TaxID=1899563 RepID=A0A1H6FFV1_9GAMM|nr:two-component regulator propeller domain-containing protein [Candidatus Venteria ishoeyi]SEH08229.1 Two component regulator propeller [Candidatus Venteria ishoeyi]
MNRHPAFAISKLLLWLFLSLQTCMALELEPAAPVLEAGASITLSVSAATGDVTWSAIKGTLQAAGLQAVYTAPQQAGVDAVTIIDQAGAVAAFKITVLAAQSLEQSFAPENALWQVFTHRGEVTAVLLSPDRQTLWVGTQGGLEQRDASSGALLQLYSNTGVLPDNTLHALHMREQTLWVATAKGLARRDGSGVWQVFNTDNSDLPDNDVYAVLHDGIDLWVGTWAGLSRLDENGRGEVYTNSNSGLAGNHVLSLAEDGQQGLWVGLHSAGLAHRDNNGNWSAYTEDDSPLPSNIINSLSFYDGVLWIGSEYGLGRLNNATEWLHYTQNNSPLDENANIKAVHSDHTGLWLAMNGSGVGHLSPDASWQVFTKDNSILPSNFNKAIVSNGEGLSWVGSALGLVQLDHAGAGRVYDEGLQALPHNTVKALYSDDAGLWIGSSLGLAQLSAEAGWQLYQRTDDGTGLPHNSVSVLLGDGEDGLWIGTHGSNSGLARLHTDGSWSYYNESNGILPHDYVNALYREGSDLWIGTNGGLVLLRADGSFQHYNPDNSDLPHADIQALSGDGAGGLWIGTDGGLAHRDVQQQWQTYSKADSDLPSDSIYALYRESEGRLWIGTAYGFVGLDADGSWSNDLIPKTWIRHIIADGNGGLWIATNHGLLRRDAKGAWTQYHSANSGLPRNDLRTVHRDNNGVVWAGGWESGLARLDFGKKPGLAGLIQDDNQRSQLLTTKRAAILIHPRGQSSGYNQAQAVDFMAAYAYHSLRARGYDNNEIYLLSHKPDLDVNQDAQADYFAVDGPVTLADFRAGTAARDLTLDDINTALSWATEQGTLEQPLLLIFIDHGIPNGLLLDPLGAQILDGATFDALLDDYQQNTNNAVTVVLEACHTGTLLSQLAADKRLIISSTGEGLAYYDDLGRSAFLKLYLDQLRQGESFYQSLDSVNLRLRQQIIPLNQQQARLQDPEQGAMARRLCLNGCWGGLPGLLTLTVTPPPAVVEPGQSLDLQVQTHIAGGNVQQVWAAIQTPEITNQRTEQGYARQAMPTGYLRREAQNVWRQEFDDFNTSGDYVIRVKAQDNSGFISEALPVTITVSGESTLQQAQFDIHTNRLSLPALSFPLDSSGVALYQVDLYVSSFEPLYLSPDMASLQATVQNINAAYANFNPQSWGIHIPILEVADATGIISRFSVDLAYVAGSEPLQFHVSSLHPFEQ